MDSMYFYTTPQNCNSITDSYYTVNNLNSYYTVNNLISSYSSQDAEIQKLKEQVKILTAQNETLKLLLKLNS